MMQFPKHLEAQPDSRAGRMLAAGNVTVTVTSWKTGQHVTVRLKCNVDNRDRTYKANGKNWEKCPLEDATHVFIDVPAADGGFGDKIGTFYPKTGTFYKDTNADEARVYAAAIVAHWLNGDDVRSTCQEESRCGVCARPLTDPVSITRGIGPECFGKVTASQHQVKHTHDDEAQEQRVAQLSIEALEGSLNGFRKEQR